MGGDDHGSPVTQIHIGVVLLTKRPYECCWIEKVVLNVNGSGLCEYNRSTDIHWYAKHPGPSVARYM